MERLEGRGRLQLGELWEYRELVFFLAWRNVKIRYTQTILGAGWAVLQPVIPMIVFTIVFGVLARMPSDGAPYGLFALAALVPWMYFGNAVHGASTSLVSDADLVTKVYLPRLAIPLAPVLAGLVDLAISLAILALALVLHGVLPGPVILIALPGVLAMLVLTTAGVSFWLSALGVQYRDVPYAVPFVLQVWMFASPVVYPMSLIPQEFRLLYALNPMAGITEVFRSALLGTSPASWGAIGMSAAMALSVFATGAAFFRRQEPSLADLV